MIAKSGIAERLRATVAKELKQDVNAITPLHTLRDDLGLNSLDAIELMFKIEEEFDLSIPDEDMQRLVTVGDVIAYLETRTARGQPEAATATRAGHSSESPGRTAEPRSGTSAAPHSGKPAGQTRMPAAPKSAAASKPKSRSKPASPSGKHTKSKGSRRHA